MTSSEPASQSDDAFFADPPPPPGMRCHLKRCIQPALDPHNARVEMRSHALPAHLKTHMVVDWSDEGDAMFHDICWKAVVDSYKMDNPFPLAADERLIIEEAWRTAEYFDSMEKIKQQSQKIANMIKEAKYAIVFTGAGISTSAGICDFRGKCGKWTERDRKKLYKSSPCDKVFRHSSSQVSPPPRLQATARAAATAECDTAPPHSKDQKQTPPKSLPNNLQKSLPTSTSQEDEPKSDIDTQHCKQKDSSNNNDQEKTFDYETRRPTYTHEALCQMLEEGHIKHIISQNTDGLHRLSGVPREKISELHGNSFIEKCERCGSRYERPYAVRRNVESQTAPKICRHCLTNHRTGRFCERKGCDGDLLNTIINFGDGLEHAVLTTAEAHARKADLVLCLGSSLCVRPACDLVEAGQKPVKLILCNRQPTPFDPLCYRKTPESGGEMIGVRVFGDCDVLIRQVMERLCDEKTMTSWKEGRGSRVAQYNKQRLTLEEALRQGSMPKTPRTDSNTATRWPQTHTSPTSRKHTAHAPQHTSNTADTSVKRKTIVKTRADHKPPSIEVDDLKVSDLKLAEDKDTCSTVNTQDAGSGSSSSDVANKNAEPPRAADPTSSSSKQQTADDATARESLVKSDDVINANNQSGDSSVVKDKP